MHIYVRSNEVSDCDISGTFFPLSKYSYKVCSLLGITNVLFIAKLSYLVLHMYYLEHTTSMSLSSTVSYAVSKASQDETVTS